MSDQAEVLIDESGSSDAGGEDHGTRFYVTTWASLLFLTLLALVVASISTNQIFLVVALLAITFLKAGLIITNFMHVRFEQRNFLLVVLTPFVTAAIMYVGMWYDFLNIPQ